MCISVFYAQVMGLWLFIVALAMIVHESRMKKGVMETASHTGMMTFSGVVSLAVGLLVVISHNMWVPAWPVVVTLVGWILLIQGILRIFWPEGFSKMLKDLLGGSGYTIMSWVWLIVGIYLIWAGFMS